MSGVPIWYAIEAQHGREYSNSPENRDDPPVLIAYAPEEAALRDALLAYVGHQPNCWANEGAVCRCGLDALRSTERGAS